MLKLFAAPPAWGLPNILPATLKLQTWLKMAGIEHELAPPDIPRAPKGKLPFVELDGGEVMGDSTLIVERLSRERGIDTDRGLSVEQKAVSHAFRRMAKEHLYWVLIFDRWVVDANFEVYRRTLVELFAKGAPPEQQEAFVTGYRGVMTGQATAQGMGRHSAEEVHRLGMGDMQAVSDYLGDKPFFMGNEPTTVDATLYAYLANILCVPIESKVRDHGRSLGNLVRYCERVQGLYFG
ncbi:MAG: glutathione S-transferase family protein [Polyangiaceae bacterium]